MVKRVTYESIYQREALRSNLSDKLANFSFLRLLASLFLYEYFKTDDVSDSQVDQTNPNVSKNHKKPLKNL